MTAAEAGPSYLQTAIDAVRRAGDLQRQAVGTSFEITKKGRIDLVTDVDLAVERMIRALYPWPTVWFTAPLYGKEKLIKLLPNKKIQVEGKRVMTYKEFVNGYQEEGKKILEKLQLS